MYVHVLQSRRCKVLFVDHSVYYVMCDVQWCTEKRKNWVVLYDVHKHTCDMYNVPELRSLYAIYVNFTNYTYFLHDTRTLYVTFVQIYVIHVNSCCSCTMYNKKMYIFIRLRSATYVKYVQMFNVHHLSTNAHYERTIVQN